VGRIIEGASTVRRGKLIKEVLRPAGDGHSQVSGWGFQWIVERMGNLFRQMRHAAGDRLQRLIPEPDLNRAFQHMNNFIFITLPTSRRPSPVR